MRRATFLSLVMGSVAATVGPGLWGHIFPDPQAEGHPSKNRELIEMPTEAADTFAFEPVEGWEVEMHYRTVSPFCWVAKEGIPGPGPALRVLQTKGLDAELHATKRLSRVPMMTYQEMLRFESLAYIGGRYKYLVLLPERTIGGEHAVGLRYRAEDKDSRIVEEQYYVLRHDGMWNFSVQSGIYHDVIDPDTYRVLDGFHWTGPYVEPSSVPSVSEDE